MLVHLVFGYYGCRGGGLINFLDNNPATILTDALVVLEVELHLLRLIVWAALRRQDDPKDRADGFTWRCPNPPAMGGNDRT